MSHLIRHAVFAAALIAGAPGLAQTPADGPAHQKRTIPVRPGSPAPTPKAPAPALPDPPIPTQHAAQAGMGRCVRAVDQLSRAELGTAYNAQSIWSQSDPGGHVFQSVAGVRNARNNPQAGVVAIIAAPVANNACDAVTVEVYPLAASCTDVQKLILKGGEVETTLQDVRVLTDGQKRRLLLLPGAGATCVALSLNSFYGPTGGPP